MNNFIEVRQVFRVLQKSWWIMLVCILIGALIGYVISINQTPVYEATTSIVVGHAIEAANVDRTDLQTSQELAPTYVDVIRRQRILQAVVEKLQLPVTWQQLRERVHVQPVDNTQFIEVTVDASSPEEAERIADEITSQLIVLNPNAQNSEAAEEDKQFASTRMQVLRTNIETTQQRIEDLEATMLTLSSTSILQLEQLKEEVDTLEKLIVSWDTAYAQLLSALTTRPATNQIAVIDRAQATLTPIQPRVQFNTLLAALVGLFIAIGLIFVFEYLTDTFQESDEVDKALGVLSLGIISRIKGRDIRDRLLSQYAIFSQPSEEYRRLRSNLQALSANWTRKVIMVTSPVYDENKSIIAANLGIVMAEAGLNVVIVDANLRQPMQDQLFQIPNTKGLAMVLLSPSLDISSCLQETSHHNLKILPAGGLPDYPSEVLGSARMEQVLARLREVADVVICDSPQVEPFADALVLSHQVDGVLLVIEAGTTRRDDAKKVIFNLRQAGAELWGVVVGSRYAQQLTVDKGRKSLPSILTSGKENDATPIEGVAQPGRNVANPLRRVLG